MTFLLTHSPSFILTFINLGLTEIIILLAIVLFILALYRWPGLLRSAQEGLQQLLDLIRPRKPWRLHNARQKRQAKPSPAAVTQTVVICSSTATFSLLFGFGMDGQISLKQTLVALGVVAVWLSVWWLCFGKKVD
jgi:Sec-independent protein translocase protein TatA